MIIDAHAHLSLFDDGKFSRKERLEHFKRFGKAAGIGKSIVIATLPVHEDFLSTAELVSLLAGEKDIYAIGAASVDFTKKDLKELKGFLEKKRIVGLKIYPGYEAFYPADKRLDPIFDLCERFDVPLLIHTGDTFGAGVGVKYAMPIHVDDLAVRRPKLKIIMAHLGNPWLTDAMEVLYRHENVYADVSALVWKGFDSYWSAFYEKEILHILKWCGKNKLLFGTDWPCNDPKEYATYRKNCVDFFRRVRLDQKDKELLFSRNALKLYKLAH